MCGVLLPKNSKTIRHTCDGFMDLAHLFMRFVYCHSKCWLAITSLEKLMASIQCLVHPYCCWGTSPLKDLTGIPFVARWERMICNIFKQAAISGFHERVTFSPALKFCLVYRNFSFNVSSGFSLNFSLNCFSSRSGFYIVENGKSI